MSMGSHDTPWPGVVDTGNPQKFKSKATRVRITQVTYPL